MKKKMIAGAMVAVAVALGSMTAFAAGIEKVDIDGITFEIPEEIRDLVTVQTQLGSEDEIVMVSETASRDAALAMEDEDGFIFLVDRKKDVIVSGGENLYPVQIEDYLRKHDKIKDVAVIGLPDPRLGEIAGAIISIKDGMTCTEDEINEFCQGLPRYKRPRKIIFDDVPRNPTGKIEKPLLRKRYSVEGLVGKENEL